ncbi:MAG TPA: hypothetical protein VFJ16_04100 [Longimicrobium sp.]|nr:hypothetical protein [Longimicrobium sp.]
MSDSDTNAGTVRAWACDDGWVVFRGLSERTPLDIRRASGQPLHADPADWWMIGRDGRVARRFTGTNWAIDDEMGATAYVVEDGALLEITTTEHVRGDRAVRETAAVPRLRPVADDDDEAARSIAAAIDREERDDAERRAAGVLAGQQRIAAIPGADERYGLGDDFDRARRLLLARLAAFDSPEVSAVLRAMAAFAALHRASPEAWRAPLAWAIEPLVAAGLIITYDPAAAALARRDWTDPNAPAAPGAEDRPPLAEMIETLSATEAELLQHARWADDTDARNTAVALYRAADAVAASRTRLRQLDGG